LEPGWQTHAYACSFLWDPVKFSNPSALVGSLKGMDYQLNLWEHAYTHSTAPNYHALEPYSGNYEVFGGLVPDFNLAEARRIFGEHQSRAFVDLGVSGFKLDECDNSDFTGGWAFPEFSRFPSGLDGEQMHSVFGLRYQDAILEAFDRGNCTTYGLVRSSGALAAPYPFVLYSDLYDHRVFIRALINSGFSGLLFCPEVRDAESVEDLIRRMQSVVFSPLAMVNGWYAQYPPWKQIHASWETFHEREKNPGAFDAGWEQVEAQCREVLGWRMQLVPYLRASFGAYAAQGTPPFRALVMDWPDDPNLALVEDEYLFGDRMLVAPVFAKQTSREIVLPQGAWCDYWTGEVVEGGRKFTVQTSLDRIPVYVKSGSVFAVAEPGPSWRSPESRRLTVRIYGDGSIPFSIRERGKSVIEITWNHQTGKGSFQQRVPTDAPYTVVGWKKMGS
jgi:alpha-D-xyloside xylohydrolase